MKREAARHARSMAEKIQDHAKCMVQEMQTIKDINTLGHYQDVPVQTFLSAFDGLHRHWKEIESVLTDMQPLLEEYAREEGSGCTSWMNGVIPRSGDYHRFFGNDSV